MPGKNSAVGAEWAVHPLALLGELDNEDRVKEKLQALLDEFEEDSSLQKNLLNEVKAAIDAWYKVYHLVILLDTRIYPLSANRTLNWPEPMDIPCPSDSATRCLAICHLAPAYFLEEGVEALGKYGIYIEKEIEEGFKKRRIGVDESSVQGSSGQNFVMHNNGARPQFEFFFSKIKPFLEVFPPDHFISEDSDWNREDYLNKCRDVVLALPIPNESFTEQYNDYVDRLRNLFEKLWGEDIKKNLHTMRSWLNSGEEVGSEDWWTTTLALPSVESNISSVFETGNVGVIKETHKVAAMAYMNSSIFTSIQKRFEAENDAETSHGLIGAINQYSKKNPSEQIWDDILSITSGAIAWQIYQQAFLTSTAMKNLTEE